MSSVLTFLGYGSTTDKYTVRYPWCTAYIPDSSRILYKVPLLLETFSPDLDTKRPSTLTLSVSPDTTLFALKTKIATLFDIDHIDWLRIAYKGIELESATRTIASANILAPFKLLCVFDKDSAQIARELIFDYEKYITENSFNGSWRGSLQNEWRETVRQGTDTTQICVTPLVRLESSILFEAVTAHWRVLRSAWVNALNRATSLQEAIALLIFLVHHMFEAYMEPVWFLSVPETVQTSSSLVMQRVGSFTNVSCENIWYYRAIRFAVSDSKARVIVLKYLILLFEESLLPKAFCMDWKADSKRNEWLCHVIDSKHTIEVCRESFLTLLAVIVGKNWEKPRVSLVMREGFDEKVVAQWKQRKAADENGGTFSTFFVFFIESVRKDILRKEWKKHKVFCVYMGKLIIEKFTFPYETQ